MSSRVREAVGAAWAKAHPEEERSSNSGHYLSFGNYTMDPEKGLTIKGVGRPPKTIRLSAPFEVLGRVRDPHSEGWGKLLHWRDDDGRQHQHFVSDADLHGDAKTLLGMLAGKGLTISIGPAKYLVGYLNGADIKDRITLVPRTGWHEIDGKTVFVPSPGSQIIVNSATVSPFMSSGTLEDWQQSVGRFADGHDRAMFAIAAAFAGPLLYFVGEGGGGFQSQGNVVNRQNVALVRERIRVGFWPGNGRHHQDLARDRQWSRGERHTL
jgi:hypothetical protein